MFILRVLSYLLPIGEFILNPTFDKGKGNYVKSVKILKMLAAPPMQKWKLQKSACDDGVKIELRPVLTQFRANLSFPASRMLLSGL